MQPPAPFRRPSPLAVMFAAPPAMLDNPSSVTVESSTTSSIIKMSNKFWTEFLLLYRQNSCLWDIQSNSYMRRDLRNAAYNVLLEKYREIDPDATLDMVKKKIDMFRTGYRRELRKVQANSCTSPGMEYTPTLWYYGLLSFLNFDDHQEENPTIIMKDSNESDDHNDDAAAVEYIEIPNEYGMPDPVINYRLKKRRMEPKRRSRGDVSVTSGSPFTFEEEDDCSTYCASLKVQMRELETQQKYIAQKLISDIIFLARTSQLTLDSSIHTKDDIYKD